MDVKVIKCPNCGATLSKDDNTCQYCDSPVFISSLSDLAGFSPIDTNKYIRAYSQMDTDADVDVQFSLAICFLKLKQYAKAKQSLEKILEFSSGFGDVYFYLAIATLAGKKPFLHVRAEIDEIESYIDSALFLEEKGVYYYLKAYIRHDYHYRKYFALPQSETYVAYLYLAEVCGMTDMDKDIVFDLLGLDRPDEI